jgi:hypothetical protein
MNNTPILLLIFVLVGSPSCACFTAIDCSQLNSIAKALKANLRRPICDLKSSSFLLCVETKKSTESSTKLGLTNARFMVDFDRNGGTKLSSHSSGQQLNVFPERLTIAEAERILSAYDKDQQIIAKTQGEGLGGGTSAARNVEFSKRCANP